MSTENAIRIDGNGPYFTKDPRARLPVNVDWSAWLERENTTIASSAWSADTGLTVASTTNTPTIATATIEGGTHGTSYTLRNTITCVNGLIDSRSIRVSVRDR